MLPNEVKVFHRHHIVEQWPNIVINRVIINKWAQSINNLRKWLNLWSTLPSLWDTICSHLQSWGGGSTSNMLPISWPGLVDALSKKVLAGNCLWKDTFPPNGRKYSTPTSNGWDRETQNVPGQNSWPPTSWRFCGICGIIKTVYGMPPTIHANAKPVSLFTMQSSHKYTPDVDWWLWPSGTYSVFHTVTF